MSTGSNNRGNETPSAPYPTGRLPEISASERDFWRRAVQAERQRLALAPDRAGARPACGMH